VLGVFGVLLCDLLQHILINVSIYTYIRAYYILILWPYSTIIFHFLISDTLFLSLGDFFYSPCDKCSESILCMGRRFIIWSALSFFLSFFDFFIQVSSTVHIAHTHTHAHAFVKRPMAKTTIAQSGVCMRVCGPCTYIYKGHYYDIGIVIVHFP
jgi:hypothetical protein